MKTRKLESGGATCKYGSDNQKPFPSDVKVHFDSGLSELPVGENGTNYKHSEEQRRDDTIK